MITHIMLHIKTDYFRNKRAEIFFIFYRKKTAVVLIDFYGKIFVPCAKHYCEIIIFFYTPIRLQFVPKYF